MAGKVYEIAFKIAGQLASGFTSSFSKANESVKGFQSQINALNKKAAETDGLIRLKKETAEAARSYLQAKQKVDALGAALGKNGRPTQQQIADFNRAKLATDKARMALDRKREALRKLETSTGTAGASLQSLIRRQKELASATDKARIAAEKQAKARGAWDSNKQSLSANAGYASMTGAAMSTGFVATVKVGADFEKAMSRVGAVSRASEEDLAKLTAQAKELGSTTVWSSSQAAEGMQYLAMAGFNTEQMLKSMPGMLSLASAGQIDLGAAADISSNILTGFGLKAEDMGRVGDVLTNAFTSSNTSLESLGATMKYAAPIAKSMGASIEETAAMAGKLGDAGIQGEMAGTTLRAVMLRLAAPSAQGAKTLKSLGVATTDAAGNMRPFQDILADLNKAMGGFSEEAKANFTKAIFETEAMSGAMVLMEQAGSGALQKYTKSLKQTGSATRVAKQQNNNLAGDFKNLTSAMEGVTLSIYDSIKPALRSLTQGLVKVVGKVQEWINEHPKLTKVLTLAAGAIGALAAAALPMLAVIKTIQFAYGLLKLPILAVNLALKAQKVQLVATKGAMIAQKAAMMIWRGAMIAATTVLKLMRGAIAGAGKAMMATPIGRVITLLGALVTAGVAVYKNWDTIKAKALSLWSSFSEKFPQIAGFVTSCFDRIKIAIETAKTVFNEIIGFVKNVFTGNWEAAWGNVQNIFKAIFDGFLAIAKKPLNAIIGMVNTVIDGINSMSFDIPSWVPGLGGESFGLNIPKVPQLASGGIATSSTLANIGEGSEPEAVLPLSKLGSMLNSAKYGAANSETINNYNTGLNDEPLLSRIDNMLRSTNNNPAESNTMSINYAPVINVNGGGGSDTYSGVKKALSEGHNNLKKELEKILANQRRLSYY